MNAEEKRGRLAQERELGVERGTPFFEGKEKRTRNEGRGLQPWLRGGTGRSGRKNAPMAAGY